MLTFSSRKGLLSAGPEHLVLCGHFSLVSLFRCDFSGTWRKCWQWGNWRILSEMRPRSSDDIIIIINRHVYNVSRYRLLGSDLLRIYWQILFARDWDRIAVYCASSKIYYSAKSASDFTRTWANFSARATIALFAEYGIAWSHSAGELVKWESTRDCRWPVVVRQPIGEQQNNLHVRFGSGETGDICTDVSTYAWYISKNSFSKLGFMRIQGRIRFLYKQFSYPRSNLIICRRHTFPLSRQIFVRLF